MNNGIRHKSPEKVNLIIENYINNTDNIYDIIYSLMIEAIYTSLLKDIHSTNQKNYKSSKRIVQ